MFDKHQRRRETLRLLKEEGKTVQQMTTWLNSLGERTNLGTLHSPASIRRLLLRYRISTASKGT